MSDPVGAGIHLKADRVAVLDALAKAVEAAGLEPTEDEQDQPDEATELRVLVTRPRQGWTSVYVEQTWRAPSLAASLARATKAPALLARKAGDWACVYQAYDAQGNLADHYHSCPDADKGIGDDDASADELARTRGDPAALSAALGGGGGPELAEVLQRHRVERLRDHDPDVLPDPDAVFQALADAFGLPALGPDFDEVRHYVAEEEDLDPILRSYAQARPRREPRGGFFRRRRKQDGADDEDDPPDDEES